MNSFDAANILGVSNQAPQDEIKKAYKKLAAQYHPDNQTTGDESKFKEINEAYQILSGKQHNPRGQSHQNPNQGRHYKDIFDDLFGGFGFDFNPFRDFHRSRDYNRPRYEHEIKVNFTLTIEDVKRGKDAVVRYEVAKECDLCNGRGCKDSSHCHTCNGTGAEERRSTNDFFVQINPCKKCNGNGRILINPCKKCNTLGFVREKKELHVEIKEKGK